MQAHPAIEPGTISAAAQCDLIWQSYVLACQIHANTYSYCNVNTIFLCLCPDYQSGGLTNNSNYFYNQMIISVIFLSKSTKKICWFQLLKSGHLMLFFVIHDSELYIWVLECWSNKTRHLKMSSWPVGNYNAHFSVFLHFIEKLINWESNQQINQLWN